VWTSAISRRETGEFKGLWRHFFPTAGRGACERDRIYYRGSITEVPKKHI
jgi:hypothetical protein